MWADSTNELKVKLQKKVMLVLIARCQNTQCIAEYVAVKPQTSQGAHADPCPFLKAPTTRVLDVTWPPNWETMI